MPVDARRLVRKMRGGAQAHLIEAADGHCYVVKFLNNPQHRRILVNEWIASVFLRYLGEVAGAVGVIQDFDDKKVKSLYEKLLHVAKRKTAEADTKLDDRGKKVEEGEEEFGENVLIVEQAEPAE